MDHPVQRPWVILTAILGVIGLGGGGTIAYSDIKSDIRVNSANIEANSILDQQRYDDVKENIDDIKDDTKYIRKLLDQLRFLNDTPPPR